MERKQEIRQRIKQERLAMPNEEWMEKSRIICEMLITHPLFLRARGILIYMDVRNEVCTRGVIRAAWKQKKKVAIPKVHGKEMEFYEILDFSQTEKGTFGVEEPKEECLVDIKGMLMVMPGVAFDRKRNRIGYGAGYYDSYLRKHPEMKTVALAFDCQIVPEVEAELHDIRPDILITERAIYQEREGEKDV